VHRLLLRRDQKERDAEHNDDSDDDPDASAHWSTLLEYVMPGMRSTLRR
jgi:hypothetical protein